MRRLDGSCTGWGALTAPGYLEQTKERYSRELEQAVTAYEEAKAKLENKKRLVKMSEETAEALEEIEERTARRTAECQELEGSLKGLQGEVTQIRKELQYDDIAAAQAQVDALRSSAEEHRARINSHERSLTEARQAADITEGVIRARKDSLPSLEQDCENERAMLSRVLRDTGFCSMNEANDALAPIGGEDGEEWLRRRKKEIDNYDIDLVNTASRVKELEEKTAGSSPVDMDELREQLSQARTAKKHADDKLTAHSYLLQNHRTVLEKVSAAKAALAGTERAYKRISELSELAEGAVTDGGRLSFDRYILGKIFREVLENANMRLDIMTGGQYELIHSAGTDRANSVAGFEMDVLDVAKGTQRPSATISGGEGFMASLALALGLSDTVQHHAGGQKLDTLFIDEGFGTLDDSKLDNVISVLQQLTEGSCLVGIISHVDKLEESITQKFRVIGGEHGSTVKFEMS